MERPDKRIHYYEVIKLAAAAGLSSDHLKKAHEREGREGALPVAGKTFSKIVKKQLTQKNRPETSKHAVSPAWQKEIAAHWVTISRPVPNAMFVVKRKSAKGPATVTELYHQQYPLKEAFVMFKTLHPTFNFKICTYLKFKPKCVKKPRSQQDACPTCKEAKRLLPRLENAHALSLTNDDKEAKLAYEFHKSVRDARYDDFNKQLETIKTNECILVLDFKANVTLGKGPVEDSHVFFRAPQRTIFGAAAFFISPAGVRFKVNFTIISAVLKHDSKTLLEILNKHIVANRVFKHFKTSKTRVWMDNAGQHFRNYETFATFQDLGVRLGQEFELNFYAEYHGKSECDRHFGLISRMYTEATRYGNCKDVHTTEDFIEMYSNGIRSFGGNVIRPNGGFWAEMRPQESGKLNVVIQQFTYDGQEEFISRIDLEGSAEEKKKPKMSLPYNRRQMVVGKDDRDVTFAMNLYYKFSFRTSRGKSVVQAKLHDKKARTEFPFEIIESLHQNYMVTFGVKTSYRPKYLTVRQVVRRRQFHEEDDFGAPAEFLRIAAENDSPEM